MLIIILIVYLFVGVVEGGIYIHNHKQEKIKQAQRTQSEEQKRKADEEILKQAKRALVTAQLKPNEINYKLAEKEIDRVQDSEKHEELILELLDIKFRVELENRAKEDVKSYQSDSVDLDKFKTAQKSISKLTSPYSKSLKEKLTREIEAAKVKADKTRKSEDENLKATSNTNRGDTNSQGTQNNRNSNSNSNSRNVSKNNNTTASQSTENNSTVSNNSKVFHIPRPGNTYPGNNTSSQGGNNSASPPNSSAPGTATYTGWVKNKSGKIVWEKAGFTSYTEATLTSVKWANSQPNPEDAWIAGVIVTLK